MKAATKQRYCFGQEISLQLRNMSRNEFTDQSAGNTSNRRGTFASVEGGSGQRGGLHGVYPSTNWINFL